MFRLAIYIVLLLFWFSPDSFAQSATDSDLESVIVERRFSEKAWKKATAGLDYSKNTNDKKNVNEDVGDSPDGKKNIREYFNPKVDGSAGEVFAGIVKIVFIFMIVGIVALLIWSILRGENIFKKQERVDTTNFDIEKIEENLEVSDLDRFIQEAESKGEYALAIRLYYLAIIKALSQQKIIRYKKNKTNLTYMLKVDDTPFGTDFRLATQAFERIWYGQSDFTQSDYEQIKPSFKQWTAKAKTLVPAASPKTNPTT